jgi:hypothetical protein
MSELYDKISSDQDPLTKIIGKIPGFDGYIERQTRRRADQALRDVIAAHFADLRTRVGVIQQDFAGEGELEYLDDLETAATKLQTFIDKVHHAAHGYSGFFDAVKINEEELAQLYQFDAALLDMEDEIGRAIDNIEASVGTDGLAAAVRHLVGLTRDLVNTFDRRDEVITGIQ